MTISATGRSRAGLTFIELLIIVIIIAVLSGLSLPKIKNTFDRLEFDSFLKDIYALCRYLQASAVTRGKIYCLNLNSENDPPEFFATFKLDQDFQKLPDRFGKVYKAPRGVTIVSLEPEGKKEIYFYPDASIDSITMTFKSRADRQAALIIKGTSGTIQIQ